MKYTLSTSCASVKRTVYRMLYGSSLTLSNACRKHITSTYQNHNNFSYESSHPKDSDPIALTENQMNAKRIESVVMNALRSTNHSLSVPVFFFSVFQLLFRNAGSRANKLNYYWIYCLNRTLLFSWVQRSE